MTTQGASSAPSGVLGTDQVRGTGLEQGIQTQAGTDQLKWVPLHLSGESQIRSASSRLSINEWSGAQLCLQAGGGESVSFSKVPCLAMAADLPQGQGLIASNFLFSSRIFQLPHFLQTGGGVHKPTLLSLHFPILAWFPGLYPLAANPGHLHILVYYFIMLSSSPLKPATMPVGKARTERDGEEDSVGPPLA